MKDIILGIVSKAPMFLESTFTGEGYHGSKKGDSITYTKYHYRGNEYLTLREATIAYVMFELKQEVLKIVK